MRTSAAALVVAATVFAPPAKARDITRDFEVAPGLEVTLWAESPMFFNPTNIDVDARGRVWVAEGVNYRRKQNQPGFLAHPGGDRIVILEDMDGDGVAESSKVFVEDPDLLVPLGVTVIGNRVFVACSPSIIVYTDVDGDDRPDRKEVFLSGFRGRDSDHGLHSVVPGPDGKLYLNTGNGGRHFVTDRDGFTVRAGSLYSNAPRRTSDDGRLYFEGLVLRIGTDARGLEVLGHNFRNSYETALDSFGNVWNNDNDDDGFASTRIAFVLRGGNHGYGSADGLRRWQADQRPGQAAPEAHWHAADPGVVPSAEIVGAGAPAGLVVYEGSLLPSRFRGALLNAEAGRSAILAHHIERAGAGFRTRHETLVRARDGADGRGHAFRPSDVAVASDGSLFVADWYDPVVGGDGMNDGKGYGRIVRIAPRGSRKKPPAIDLMTVEGARAAFLSPSPSLRFAGAERLVAGGRPVLEALLASRDTRVRARALFALARTGEAGRPHVERALTDRDPALRIVALRALETTLGAREAVRIAAPRLAADPDATVRRELAVLLRTVPRDEARAPWLALWSRHAASDRFMLEALGLGAEGREDPFFAAALDAHNRPDPLAWSPALAELAFRLHPASAVPALLARARAAKLPRTAREQALVGLASSGDAAAAQAALALALDGPEDTRALARFFVEHRGHNAWKEHGVLERLAEAARTRPDPKAEAARALELHVLDTEAPMPTRSEAAKTLAQDPRGGVFLIGLAQRKKLPPELASAIAEVIFSNPDPSVRAMASEHFERPAFEGTPFPPVAELLRMKGDVARGKTVFFGNTAACSRCHTWNGQGHAVGPDLSDIGAKFGRDGLLDAVLNPSAGIAFGYEPWVISTKSGESHSGFVVGDGDPVILKEVSGEQRLIPAKDIADRQRSNLSLMPDNIALGLGAQDLVDLVAFLSASKR